MFKPVITILMCSRVAVPRVTISSVVNMIQRPNTRLGSLREVAHVDIQIQG